MCILKCDASEIELCGKFVIYSRIHYLKSRNLNAMYSIYRLWKWGIDAVATKFSNFFKRHIHTHTPFTEVAYVKLNFEPVYSRANTYAQCTHKLK